MTDDVQSTLASPGEHKKDDCWCGHAGMAHHFDPDRDYRELKCRTCAASPPPSFGHFAFDLMDEDDEREASRVIVTARIEVPE